MSIFGKPSERELVLERALWTGNVATVEALLDIEPALVTELNFMNGTWLVQAIGVSSVEAVRLFLERGADVNFKGDDGDSPMHAAVRRDQVVAGPSLRTNIDDCSTPLEDADAYGRPAIAAYLRSLVKG
jgi:ankyrin repeat protein